LDKYVADMFLLEGCLRFRVVLHSGKYGNS